jgi:Sir2 family
VIEAHGSFASSRCIECKTPYDNEKMAEHIAQARVPRCPEPDCNGLVKPDIVFFGESVSILSFWPSHAHQIPSVVACKSPVHQIKYIPLPSIASAFRLTDRLLVFVCMFVTIPAPTRIHNRSPSSSFSGTRDHHGHIIKSPTLCHASKFGTTYWMSPPPP